MEDKAKRSFREWQEEMESAEEWSVLEDELMLTGGNNYLHRDEALRVVERMQNRMKHKY